MTEKTFHISDLLSIHPGALVSRDHIGGVYNILGHMTGDALMTHQLPLACDAMLPELLLQHPWLKDITAPNLSTEAECITWVASIADVHGEYHQVESAPLAWGRHDPLQDFKNEYPDKQIIVLTAPGETP